MTPRKKPSIPVRPVVSPDRLEKAFPGGFTIRDEANAITAYAFRNGPIETLHSGKSSPLTDDPEVSRITDEEMKEIMISASERLAAILEVRDKEPAMYRRFIHDYAIKYCCRWDR